MPVQSVIAERVGTEFGWLICLELTAVPCLQFSFDYCLIWANGLGSVGPSPEERGKLLRSVEGNSSMDGEEQDKRARHGIVRVADSAQHYFARPAYWCAAVVQPTIRHPCRKQRFGAAPWAERRFPSQRKGDV